MLALLLSPPSLAGRERNNLFLLSLFQLHGTESGDDGRSELESASGQQSAANLVSSFSGCSGETELILDQPIA